MRVCFHCGAELSGRQRVPFKELCPKCDAFLHCCKNCRLYAPGAHNSCLSTTTESVTDVERANYCEEFEFRETEVERPKESRRNHSDRTKSDPPSNNSGGRSAREKFENLFKD